MNFRIPDVTGKIVGATEMTTAGGVILLGYWEKSEYGVLLDVGEPSYPVPILEECRHLKYSLASRTLKRWTGVVHSLELQLHVRRPLSPKQNLKNFKSTRT